MIHLCLSGPIVEHEAQRTWTISASVAPSATSAAAPYLPHAVHMREVQQEQGSWAHPLASVSCLR